MSDETLFPFRQGPAADRLPPVEPERYELFEEPRYLFEPDRRDFLKTLGGGIVVCCLVSAAAAQPPQRQGRGPGARPQEISAWVQINEAGEVLAFSGKVEIGQNVRTALCQVVAEELHVAPAAVRLTLADTDLVPFDMGTFGSRSSPDMVPQLQRAAAAARELLLDFAAQQPGVDRAGLTVADGKVTHQPSGRSWTFGELTKGKKLAKTIAGEAVTPPARCRVRGTSVPKVDGRAIVTGKHRYASDVKRPGMLYGKVLRPSTLGGTLASADLSAAQALPGVTAVREGEFVGVAAPTEEKAEQALAAIKAEWKPGPPASGKDLFDQLKKSAGQGGQGGPGGEGFGGRGGESRGNVEQGLAEADHRLSATYTIAYIAHVPLETRAAVAEWADGKLTVWTGTQRPFGVRSDLARAFGLPPERVRVIVPDTGSGYGGKHTVEAATEAARLAKAAGKPVRVAWTREEEFTWAYFRPAGVIEVTAGVKKDGTVTAWDFHNYNSGPSAIRPLYDIANVRAQFHAARSPLRQGSYRALAATANHFARESHMDDLARAAGLDPLAFRLKNLGDTRLKAVLEAAARQFGWPGRPRSAEHGHGIAGGFEKGSYVATCAEVAVNRADGKVRVVRLVTAFECGAVVNPDHLKNQVEGAVVMGLGGALFEHIDFDGGRVLNASLARYRVPRFSDLPALEVVLLDRKDLPASGAGETPIVAVAPAVGNAICQVTGVRLRTLPMVPDGFKV